MTLTLFMVAAGRALLVAGAELLVRGASTMARAVGMHVDWLAVWRMSSSERETFAETGQAVRRQHPRQK
jgi:hypothetical protein